MARLALVTFAAILSLTSASPDAPRQYSPKPQPPPQQSQYQQPLPRPLTEVLSSNLLLQMADLVAGRPSAMPPTLTEDSGRRSPFNSLAARQAIAMTDSQQVGVIKGKDDDTVGTNTSKNTSCARAIVVCCKSENVRHGCFEALGCPGFFVGMNPCSPTIVQQLVH